MRDKLGVFLMEKDDGTIDVQLFEDPDKLAEVYKNLVRLPKDEVARATMMSITHEGDGSCVSVDSKMLPVPMVPAKDRPDGIRLGDGPIHLPEEGKDGEDEEE